MRVAGQEFSTLPPEAALTRPPPAAAARGRVLRGGRRGAGRARAAGRDALRLPPAALKPPRPEGGEPRPERRFSCGPLRRGGRGTSLPPPAPGSPGGRSRPWHPAVRCRSLRVPGAGSVCAPLPPPALRCLPAARAAFLGSLLPLLPPLRRGLFCCAVPGMCPRPGLRGAARSRAQVCSPPPDCRC